MSTDNGREAKRGVLEVVILACAPVLLVVVLGGALLGAVTPSLLSRRYGNKVSVKAAQKPNLFNGSDPINDDLLIAAFQDMHGLNIQESLNAR